MIQGKKNLGNNSLNLSNSTNERWCYSRSPQERDNIEKQKADVKKLELNKQTIGLRESLHSPLPFLLQKGDRSSRTSDRPDSSFPMSVK